MTISSSRFSKQAGIDNTRKQMPDTRPDFTRSDPVIEEEIWNGIIKDRCLGAKYQENIEVEVEDGRVKLRGHVLKRWHIPLIVNIADRVEGVVWIKSELVADDILQEQVVKALLQDDRTAPYVFTVKSAFGWIHLRGLVPISEVAKAAEGVAGFVPNVRGILSLPSVFGANLFAVEELESVRRALQPRIGSGVYQDGDGSKPVDVGQVAQVVIDPCSRLVSAIAVRVTGRVGDSQEPVDRLVPMTAVEAVNEKHVWLKEGAVIDQYPPFEQKLFPLPPANWHLPFPYFRGLVRWSLSPE